MGRDPASPSFQLRNGSSSCYFQVIARHLLPITAFPKGHLLPVVKRVD